MDRVNCLAESEKLDVKLPNERAAELRLRLNPSICFSSQVLRPAARLDDSSVRKKRWRAPQRDCRPRCHRRPRCGPYQSRSRRHWRRSGKRGRAIVKRRWKGVLGRQPVVDRHCPAACLIRKAAAHALVRKEIAQHPATAMQIEQTRQTGVGTRAKSAIEPERKIPPLTLRIATLRIRRRFHDLAARDTLGAPLRASSPRTACSPQPCSQPE